MNMIMDQYCCTFDDKSRARTRTGGICRHRGYFPTRSHQGYRGTIWRGRKYGVRKYSLWYVPLNVSRSLLSEFVVARAFNSEHQMELINECSIRFAEDKDFRLLVFSLLYFYYPLHISSRSSIVSWRCFVRITLGEEN